MHGFRSFAAALLIGAVALSSSVAQAENGVTDDKITMGGYGPLTGAAAFIGLGGRDGAELAIEEINADGGIHGRQLELIFEDDNFSPTRALGAVRKLVERDEVFMILGLSGSGPTIGTLEYAKRSEVPNYIAIASAPQVTTPFSEFLFRGASTESERFGELYAEFLAEFLQVERIAILSGSDENATNEADNTAKKLEELYDIKIAARAEFKVGDTDFTPQILEVRNAEPEIILAVGQTPEVSIVLRQIRELGMRQPVYGGAAAVDTAIIENAGLAAEGYMGGWLTPLFLDSAHPDMQAFLSAWNAKYPGAAPGRPNLYDIMGYTETYVVAEAMDRAGPDLDRAKFIAALETLDGYRVSEIASPRTFTDWHHIGNLNQQMMVVLAQRWVPLRWDPQRESDILNKYRN